jgi:hypothetical protein
LSYLLIRSKILIKSNYTLIKRNNRISLQKKIKKNENVLSLGQGFKNKCANLGTQQWKESCWLDPTSPDSPISPGDRLITSVKM